MENQEKELSAERQHLAQVQQLIQNEMNRQLAEMGVMKQDIVDYRKDLTEESLKEQSRMTVGSDVAESQYMAAYQRVLELSRMYYMPYFGMICFREEGETLEESYYIGKRGLTQEGDPLILDWRTPAASLFYQQHLGEMSFRAPNGDIRVDLLIRRQYIIKDGELKGMFDSELDIKDDILQMVLSGSSGDRLKEVIATIQKEQDDLIRVPLEENVLLDGVAGSGKTTIILHRVAYLLYNYREKLKDNILILGPNQIFMEYISQVLPDLGETEGTHQRTLRKLAQEVLGLHGSVMKPRDYFEKLMHGEDSLWQRRIYEKADAAYIKVLEQAYEAYEEKQRMTEDLSFDGKVLLKAEEGNELFYKTYRNMPYHRRVMRIKRLINSRLKDLRDRRVRRLQKEYDTRIKEAKQQGQEELVNRLRFEQRSRFYDLMVRLYEFRTYLRTVYEIPDTECWYRSWICGDQEQEWTEEDLWAMLYIAGRFHGRGLFDVKHLVVDEAQDVSALGLAALLQLTDTESLTIVGDVRQKIKGRKYPSLMDEWQKVMPAQIRKKTRDHQLRRSYRSTREIMEYAMKDLEEDLRCPIETVERPGEPVRQWTGTLDSSLEAQLQEGLGWLADQGMERVAVLTENMAQARYAAELLGMRAELVTGELRKTTPDKIPVMPVYFAKGLEYDGVIVLDTMKDSLSHYVLCTRALHRLLHIKLQ